MRELSNPFSLFPGDGGSILQNQWEMNLRFGLTSKTEFAVTSLARKNLA